MIHQYKLKGYNVVLDVYSGSVHLVDDVCYDIIQLFCEKEKAELIEIIYDRYKDREDVTKEELEEVYCDIKHLKEAGKLFTEDIYKPKAGFLKNKNSDVKALCLHVAHSCNLTCSYCFAGQGKFQGDSALMSLDTAKRAIDFLIENSGNRHNLEVDFFGGEPLLNFNVVKETVKYARSIEKEAGKNFRFTLTTNGVGITDEVIEFANKECHNVVLSLDGRREIHDRERRTCSGEGSYDIVVPKFKKLVDARDGKGYYMRGTFTQFNKDFVKDIEHMLELGFKELSIEPVVSSPDEPYALTEKDLEELYLEYEKLADLMLEKHEKQDEFSFYHYMIDLNNGPCVYKRISGCGSGTEYFAVTPWGELYPCHQFVGEEEYKLGDIWQGVTKKDIVEGFKECNIYSREDCHSCWAKLYCSGGCAANAYHATGDIKGVYDFGCDLFRKRIECAIMVEVAKSNESL